ncbi:hypothetical protein ACIGGE_05745 [Qipengyuania sp. NPDC077410]|uniref:hypothetical protein n=1 Tax=Qipengyuania sp. NPDC077410 TaxID=3364496 RepID=UPI0037CC97E0
MTQTYLADHVSVAPRYQRSVRIDADFGQADPLSGYVLQGSARDALTTTLRLATNGQGAFTWTGPYGGGKSSLALALASYSLGRGPAFKEAKQLLGDVPEVTAVFGRAPKDWLCVSLSGRRGDPVADLREALASAIAGEPGHARTKRSKMEAADGRDIVERLQREVEARPKGGVLVIVDELGKYLEGAADHAIDIHFFQDLAEAANRSEGRLIVVGVLHQAFERYADRLGQSVQDEWRKIQGRFADVPIITAVDEVIELVGRAVTTERSHPQSHPIAAIVASEIAERRPGVPKDLAERLDDCWPLNPAAAALLGPITRRRFSQNERSLFGFLASAEPSGFTEFLQRTTLASGKTFRPAELWDYLQVNLEPAIMASPDGHRWAQAAEAIARAGRDGTHLRLQIAKTVAVIDLFSNGSGLAASPRTIAASLGHSDADVEDQLADLVKISALVYRRHLGAYAIYAGSDFDIEGEIEARIAERGRLEIASLNDLASLQPILAKRHYAEYGTPRWFDAQIGELAPQGLGPKDVRVSAGAAGKFLLLLPGIDVDPDQAEASLIEVSRTEHRHGLPVIVGLASNSADIRKTAIELEAARDVRNESPELAGDAAARREIDARIAHLSAQLEGLLRDGFERAHWFDTGKPLDLQSLSYGLSQAASDIARRTFRQAPIVHSELINRRRPSSNSNAALRALLHAIVVGRGEQHFGIKGYPAEKGLAVTVLERAGLYVRQGERWDFVPPSETSTFAPLWSLTDDLLEAGEQVCVADIYRAWGEPPYGVQQGVMPLLIVTYLFSRRHSTAVYAKEAFQPAISDLVMDLLLQDPEHIALRSVPTDAANAVALKEFAAVASEFVEEAPSEEPLDIAQALVQFAYSLPNWSRKAQATLSKQAIDVRRLLLDADDPYQFLFVDIPEALEASGEGTARALRTVLSELDHAYPDMIEDLKTRMLEGLKHRDAGNLAELVERAKRIAGHGGDDLKLRGFITRLAEFDGSTESMAEICGLVMGKPVTTWHDLEPSRAAMQLSEYAYRFRRVELFGDSDQQPTQTAVMVMAGVGSTERSVVRRAQIATEAQKRLGPLLDEIGKTLDAAQLEPDMVLAVIAELAQRHIEDDGERDVTVPISAEKEA